MYVCCKTGSKMGHKPRLKKKGIMEVGRIPRESRKIDGVGGGIGHGRKACECGPPWGRTQQFRHPN